MNKPPTRAPAPETPVIVESRGFWRARSPQGMLRECFGYIGRAPWREGVYVPRDPHPHSKTRRADDGAVNERIHRLGYGVGMGLLDRQHDALEPDSRKFL